MDLTNPRWQPSRLRRANSALFWKVLVTGVLASALTTVAVVVLVDPAGREETGRDATESSATATEAPVTAAPAVLTEMDAGAASTSAETQLVDQPPAVADEPEAGMSTATMARPMEGDSGQLESSLPPVADVNASTTSTVAQPEVEPMDAGEELGRMSSRAPVMTEGAGRFLTEPPLWAASAMTSNPDAGAGRFLTEPPSWAASAMTPDPNAGAGPFSTEAPPFTSSAWTSDPEAGAGPFETERSIAGP